MAEQLVSLISELEDCLFLRVAHAYSIGYVSFLQVLQQVCITALRREGGARGLMVWLGVGCGLAGGEGRESGRAGVFVCVFVGHFADDVFFVEDGPGYFLLEADVLEGFHFIMPVRERSLIHSLLTNYNLSPTNYQLSKHKWRNRNLFFGGGWSIIFKVQMGNQCEACGTVEAENKNTLVLDTNQDYNLQPEDFYNEKTKEIASRLGPFKFDEEEHHNFVSQGPVDMGNGVRYIGQFSNGMRNGRGKQVWEDFSLYEGYWVDDRANGRGRLIHANGDVYEGDWKDDKAHGKGVYTKQDGSSYTGEWHDDIQHGYGIEKWTDSSSYEGQHYEGAKQGKGKFTWPDGSVYEGNFDNNVMEGFGRIHWIDGKEYEGHWKDNKMHGKGIFKWPDGRVYEGDYLNDKKHGFGRVWWPDGREYEGEWQNGVQHGEGKYKGKDGMWKEGRWQNGKRLR